MSALLEVWHCRTEDVMWLKSSCSNWIAALGRFGTSVHCADGCFTRYLHKYTISNAVLHICVGFAVLAARCLASCELVVSLV